MAIDLFQGYEVNGKRLKVEPIRDHEKYGRIRVPGKIIDYAVGPLKMSRNGLNTMRRATSASSRLDSGVGGDDEREQRNTRLQKRKTRGRYKNQQRKNSRAIRMPYVWFWRELWKWVCCTNLCWSVLIILIWKALIKQCIALNRCHFLSSCDILSADLTDMQLTYNHLS